MRQWPTLMPVFEDAFRVFWRPPPGEWSSSDLRAMGEQRRFGTPKVDVPGAEAGSADAALPVLPDRIERVAAMTYGAQDVSRVKDFAQFTEEELHQAQAGNGKPASRNDTSNATVRPPPALSPATAIRLAEKPRDSRKR